jgi:hypothetical protein
LMGVQFKHSQYWLFGWLNEYIGTFIKKSKYIYSLPQR